MSWGGTFIWFDNRNASIALTTGPRAMAEEVLVRSRERLLAGLQAAAAGSGVLFRSDRDGPIRHRTRAGGVGCDHEYLAAGCD